MLSVIEAVHVYLAGFTQSSLVLVGFGIWSECTRPLKVGLCETFWVL